MINDFQSYKKMIIGEFDHDTKLNDIVNYLFFQNGMSIKEWLNGVEITNFDLAVFNKKPFRLQFCHREKLDSLQTNFEKKNIVENKNQIFVNLILNSIEEASDNDKASYHLVADNYYDILDSILFSQIPGYEKMRNREFVRKVSKDAEIWLVPNLEENTKVKSLSTYSMPSVFLKFKNQMIGLGKLDIRSLLFLPAGSFFFFYIDSHDFTIDDQANQIVSVSRKKDEPIFEYLSNENKFSLSNSKVNIDRYNKYIETIIKLSIHFFRIQEKWIIKELDKY